MNPGRTTAPRGWVPGGESHNIHIRGGRYISLVGGSQLFHLQSDRWPDAVDVPAISRTATAFADLIAAMARDNVRVGPE